MNELLIRDTKDELSKDKIIQLLKRAEKGEINIKYVIEMMQNSRKEAVVYKDRIELFVNVEEIYYISVIDGVTKVFTKNECYNSYHSLDKWEKTLKEKGINEFYRSQRNCIVNIMKIKKIDKIITFNNGDKAQVSTRKLKRMKVIFESFIGI